MSSYNCVICKDSRLILDVKPSNYVKSICDSCLEKSKESAQDWVVICDDCHKKWRTQREDKSVALTVICDNCVTFHDVNKRKREGK